MRLMTRAVFLGGVFAAVAAGAVDVRSAQNLSYGPHPLQRLAVHVREGARNHRS
jgi:hypothetical protein